MIQPILRAALLGAITIAANAFAGQQVSDGKSDGKKIIHEPMAEESPWVMNMRSSYTGESDFKRGRNASGDSFYKGVDVSRRFSLAGAGLPALSKDGGWYLRVGFDYNRWDFGNTGALPIPNHLQSAAADLALEYLVNGQIGFLLETEPGVYFQNDVRANNFDAPTKLVLTYPVTDRFVLVGGVSYTSMRSYPFIPLIGFSWTINDQWKISAIPPEPRIIYTASDKLQLWAGGELAGGSFRVDDMNSHKEKTLDHAVVDYSEWRAGAGLTYKVSGVELDLGAGYAFQRKFDYHRANAGYETDQGAPYVKLRVSAAF